MSSISGLGSGSGWPQMHMRASHADRQQIASEAFAKIDTGNQGYFDESGFETAINQALSTTQSTKSYSAAQIQTAFNKLDSDGDGKVTQQEFTSTLSQLKGRHHHQEAGNASDGHDNSTGMSGMVGMQGMGGMQGMMGMPPPPPPGDAQNGQGSDAGFTADELKAQLDEIGISDAKRSTLIKDVLNNFSKADADGDGKVNLKEAMALEQSLASSSSTGSTTSTKLTTSAATTSSTEALQQKFMQQLMKMMEAYGQNLSTGSASSTTLSVTA